MSLKHGNRELFVVGDRVLVEPEAAETTTRIGLLLPASVVEKEDVRGGKVVALGPGQPLPPPTLEEDEPWKTPYRSPRYLPMQVELGDYALFFRKAAIEIRFDETDYLVVPHGAILVLVRGNAAEDVPDELPDDLLPEDLD